MKNILSFYYWPSVFGVNWGIDKQYWRRYNLFGRSFKEILLFSNIINVVLFIKKKQKKSSELLFKFQNIIVFFEKRKKRRFSIILQCLFVSSWVHLFSFFVPSIELFIEKKFFFSKKRKKKYMFWKNHKEKEEWKIT